MKRIAYYLLFSFFVICRPAYCHTFEAIHFSEDGTEAVLREKVTGDEWVVQVGDEIDGNLVTQITMNYVTIIHSGDNGVVYSTDIPIKHKKNIIKASP